jgi:hypothetical protein
MESSAYHRSAGNSLPRKLVRTVARGLLPLLGGPKGDAPGDKPAEPTLFWGLRHLPFSDATQRFLVIGSPGSGKTTLLELLMRSVLGYVVTPGFNHRALIYDAKRDMLPILAGMGLTVETEAGRLPEVRTLNPFDTRGFAWDMAKDIDCPAAALQVATILIPQEAKSSQPFFSDAARQLLYAVMLRFLDENIKDWTLRQVILILKNGKRLRALLRSSKLTADLATTYFGNTDLNASILTTVDTKLLHLEIVAALWDQARKEGRTFSLVDWVNRDGSRIFSEQAITNLPALAERLKNAAKDDAVSQYLSGKLSEPTRKLLAGFGGGAHSRLQQALADDLNQILQRETLFDAWRFVQHRLSPAAQKLIAQDPSGSDLVRLNRMLLEEAYPQAISRDHGNFILVLGNHPSNRAALEAINKAIFRRITDLLLTQNEVSDHKVTGRKTWLFLDEVRDAGKLDGLSSLLNQGRSKGVCTVVGFQDIEGMRTVYDPTEANEIIGQCDNKTVLRTESFPTAQWAESHFGLSLLREYTLSEGETTSSSGISRNRTVGEHIQLRAAVMEAEFMTIPRTGPKQGIKACNDLPLAGAYWATADWATITAMRSGPL